MLVVFGVLYVPVHMVWGDQEIYIKSFEFKPVWILMNKGLDINGFTPRYELDVVRCIYQLIIITLITSVIYLLCYFISKRKI